MPGTSYGCADLTEHSNCRQAGIDGQERAEIICLAGIGDRHQGRFEAAQRTCALRWLAVLWKQRDRRAEEFTSQLGRVRGIQAATAGT